MKKRRKGRALADAVFYAAQECFQKRNAVKRPEDFADIVQAYVQPHFADLSASYKVLAESHIKLVKQHFGKKTAKDSANGPS